MSELLPLKRKEKTILKVKDWKYKKDRNSSMAIGYEALIGVITEDNRNAVGYSALDPVIVNGLLVGFSQRSYGVLHINTPTEQSISFKPDKQ